MASFGEFEKGLIREMLGQEETGVRGLGDLVKDRLFEQEKGAFVICGRIEVGPEAGRRVTALLATTHLREVARVRAKVVSFVSLMRYLEEHRLVYLVKHDNPREEAIFYQGSHSVTLRLDVVPTQRPRVLGNYAMVLKQDTLDNGEVVKIEKVFDNFRDGQIRQIYSRGIWRDGGEVLVNKELGSQLQEELADYLLCHVYPSVSLVDLVANDFLFPEERMARKQMRIAQYTLRVAVITLLVAVVLPLFGVAPVHVLLLVGIIMAITFAVAYFLGESAS